MRALDPELLAARRALMLAAMPVGVVLLEANGCLLEANQAAHRLLGLSDNARSMSDVDRRVTDPISGAPLSTSEMPWNRALAGETVFDRDVSVVSLPPRQGRRLITISARPFHDPASRAPGALVLAFDRLQLLLRQTLVTDLPPYLRRVLALLGRGRSTSDIARELNLTVATTRLYIKRLHARLGVNNRSQLVLRAVDLGFDQSFQSELAG